ncbi:MAG: hypothetical protein A3G93_13465 [Nitrospinae bacterium RIFCSPLOWO2_12_FULL_45_22]|nr:MAG: hypothetical protein A3G93_13465 [Nitrospinae bacterium RIFCSPLOWO2_12_FULL_45_22]
MLGTEIDLNSQEVINNIRSEGIYQIDEGNGSCRVSLRAFALTNGIIVHITGGDEPHIGGVAVGLPRPSTQDPSRVTANVSVISILGHKDDELARPIADRLVRELNSIIVVIAGVHIHQANQTDIERIIDNTNLAVEEFLRQIKTQ